MRAREGVYVLTRHNDRCVSSTGGPEFIVSMTHIVRLCAMVALDVTVLNTTDLNATVTLNV